MRRGSHSEVAYEWYVGPIRILWWRLINSGWSPIIGSLYGRGFMFWWGKLAMYKPT